MSKCLFTSAYSLCMCVGQCFPDTVYKAFTFAKILFCFLLPLSTLCRHFVSLLVSMAQPLPHSHLASFPAARLPKCATVSSKWGPTGRRPTTAERQLFRTTNPTSTPRLGRYTDFEMQGIVIGLTSTTHWSPRAPIFMIAPTHGESGMSLRVGNLMCA